MSEHAHSPNHGHDHGEAGPWLDDARRILTLIETAGQQYASHAQATRPADAPAGECTWCPLCQALSVARRSAPDLLDRVAELASGLAATIRATTPQAPDGPAPAAAAYPVPPADRVQEASAAGPAPPETVRIDITD